MPADQFIDQTQAQPLEQKRPIKAFDEMAPEVAFGGDKSALDEATGRAARSAGELYQQHRDQANAASAMDYMGQLTRYKLDQLYNKDYGVLNKQGKDVLDSDMINDRSQKFQEYVAFLEKSAPNDDVRKYIHQHGDEEFTDFTEQFDEHISKQVQEQAQNNALNLNQATMDDALLKAASGNMSLEPRPRDQDGKVIDAPMDSKGNPIPDQTSIEEIDDKIRSASGVAGLPQEQQQAQVDDFHARLLRQYIDQNKFKDADYLFNHATFDKQEFQTLSALLEKSKDGHISSVAADVELRANKFDAVKAKEALDKRHDDGNLTDEQHTQALKDLDQNIKIKNDIDKQNSANHFFDAFSSIQKWRQENPTVPATVETLLSAGVITHSQVDSLDASDRGKLDDTLNPEKTKTEYAWGAFLNDINKDPGMLAGFTKEQLYQKYASQMNARDAKAAEDIWKTDTGGGVGHAKQIAALIPVNMLKSRLVEQYGADLFNDKSNTEDANDKLAMLMARTYRIAEEQMEINGGTLKPQEASDIVDQQIKRTFSEGFFGTKTPNFLMTGEDIKSMQQDTAVNGNSKSWYESTKGQYTEDQQVRLFQILLKYDNGKGQIDTSNMSSNDKALYSKIAAESK